MTHKANIKAVVIIFSFLSHKVSKFVHAQNFMPFL
jgi:hypothetical protein